MTNQATQMMTRLDRRLALRAYRSALLSGRAVAKGRHRGTADQNTQALWEWMLGNGQATDRRKKG